MKIDIDTKSYNHLLNICKNSELEECGLIRLKIDGDTISLLDITPSNYNEITFRNNNKIQYDYDKFIHYFITTTLLFDPAKEIWVHYHTHPGIYAKNGLSNADINLFKEIICLRNKAYVEGFKITPPLQVCSVITEDEVGFYSIINNEIIKHEVSVNGKVIKNSKNDTTLILKRTIKRIFK